MMHPQKKELIDTLQAAVDNNELTPQQLSTKNDTKRRDAVAQALGFGSMRRFGTKLVEAHKMRTLDKFIAELSPENANLRDVLKEVMLWVDNWTVPFKEDDEWPQTEAKVKEALKEKRE